MIEKLPKHKKIILFDGVCNLCNNAINYVIDHDTHDVFRFVSLQSELGKTIKTHMGYTKEDLDSIILYLPNEAYYIKSTAALKIIEEFGTVWKLARIFLLLPSFIRDAMYNYIAKNRYKWYGKQESCRIPTPELQNKFLT